MRRKRHRPPLYGTIVGVTVLAAALGSLTVNRTTSAADVQSGTGISVQVAVSPTQLQCEGDSAKLTAVATNPDGSPASGVTVAVSIWPAGGKIAIPGVGDSTGQLAGPTNGAGKFEARLTPAPGTKNLAYFYVTVAGATSYIGGPFYVQNGDYELLCPFRNTRYFTIDGTVYIDDNGDGVLQRGERVVPHVAVSLEYLEYHGTILPHTTYTDSAGRFEFTGLWPVGGTECPCPEWEVCIEPDALVVTSVNGVPPVYKNCIVLDALQPGANTLSIAVRKLAPTPGTH